MITKSEVIYGQQQTWQIGNGFLFYVDGSAITPLTGGTMNPDGSGSAVFNGSSGGMKGTHIIMVADVFGNSASAPLTVVYP
jgi:hypothetical protein